MTMVHGPFEVEPPSGGPFSAYNGLKCRSAALQGSVSIQAAAVAVAAVVVAAAAGWQDQRR